MLNEITGGEGGIRTPGTLARTSHFECDAIDHSATSPHFQNLWSPPLNSQDRRPCQAPFRPVVDRAQRPARNRPDLKTKAHHDDRRFSAVFTSDCPRNRR